MKNLKNFLETHFQHGFSRFCLLDNTFFIQYLQIYRKLKQQKIRKIPSTLLDIRMVFGAVAERLKATVLKTVVPKGTGGSNPSCSVEFRRA